MTDKKKHNHSKLYRRLFFEIRPYFFHLAGILLITLLSTPLALLTPLPLKIAVDSVIGSHPLPTFVQPILPSALAGSTDGILIFVIAFNHNDCSPQWTPATRKFMVAHLYRGKDNLGFPNETLSPCPASFGFLSR